MGYYDNYLEHKLGGWTRKNHKYIGRERGKNGKWKYIYPSNSTGRSSSGSKGNSVLNLLKRFGEDTVDKIGDTFDKDYDHVLDLFDKDVRSNLIQKINKTDNGLMTSVEYDKYNRQFERRVKRGEVKKEDWEFVDPGDGSLNKKSSRVPQEENVQSKHKYVAKIMVNGKYRYFYTTGELRRFYERNPQYKPEGAEDLPLKTKPMTEDEDMAQINKHYDPEYSELGWGNNCYDCTLAYDARRRGYDVEAVYDPNGATEQEISDLYKDGLQFTWKETDLRSAKEFEAEITQQTEDGDYGQFLVYWYGGGGHSMVWENNDGEVVIRDCQTNETYEPKEILDYAESYSWAQTNDKEISPDAYKKYLQPADDVNEVANRDDWKWTKKDYDDLDLLNDTWDLDVYYDIYDRLKNKEAKLDTASIDDINNDIYRKVAGAWKKKVR